MIIMIAQLEILKVSNWLRKPNLNYEITKKPNTRVESYKGLDVVHLSILLYAKLKAKPI